MDKRLEEDDTPVRQSRSGLGEWVALGALVAGSIGAIAGVFRSRRRGAGRSLDARPSGCADPESITAPHGDKLGPPAHL